MEILFVVALMAGFLLPIELQFTPSWVSRVTEWASGLEPASLGEQAAR